MYTSIEDYAERQSKRSFRRRKYKIVPARIAHCTPRMKGVRAVLWDVYGTLMALSIGDLESALARKETMLEAFRRTINEFGLGKFLSGNRAETLLNFYVREIEKAHNRKRARGVISPEVKIEHIWIRVLRRLESNGYTPDGGKNEIDLDTACRIAYFFDDVYQTKVIYPGAKHTLQRIRQLGLKQGIISNAQFYTPIALNLLLRKAGYESPDPHRDLFDRRLVFYSYRLGVSKPNPFAFERARDRLAAMGVEASHAIVVGNDVLNDMLPARRVGFKAVLFAGDRESLTLRRDHPECAAFKPDATIKSLPQLLDIIR